MQDKLDLYPDYLLTTVHQATAMGLLRLVDGALSHDSVSRLLSENKFSSKDLWQSVKKLVRPHETDEGCLIFDDSIIEKRYTDSSALICWYYDHSTGKSVKEINLLTGFYYSHSEGESSALRVPVGFELVLKTIHLDLSDDDFTTTYKKRWSVAVYHKSLIQDKNTILLLTTTINNSWI